MSETELNRLWLEEGQTHVNMDNIGRNRTIPPRQQLEGRVNTDSPRPYVYNIKTKIFNLLYNFGQRKPFGPDHEAYNNGRNFAKGNILDGREPDPQEPIHNKYFLAGVRDQNIYETRL